MKRWVWLWGTISSISFAQIANAPNANHLNSYRYLKPQFYSGIFPTSQRGNTLGAYTENTFVGTDLHYINAWATFDRTHRNHRIELSYSGSPDWNQIRFHNSHFIALNPALSLGVGLGFNQLSGRQKTAFDAGFHALYRKKNLRLLASLHHYMGNFDMALGGSLQQKEYTAGLAVIREGTPYQGYAYMQFPLSDNYQALITLGTGSKRIQVALLKSFNRFHLQVGGAWWNPLQGMQLFMQLQYDGKIRGDGTNTEHALPDSNGAK